MTLDPATLGLAAVLLLAVLGALLFLSWLANPRREALAWWGAAFAVAAGGIACVGPTRGEPHWGLLLLGNALIAAAYALQYTGCRAFSGRPLSLLAGLAGPALWLSAWPFIGGWYEARLLLMSAIATGYNGVSAFALFGREGERLATQRAAIGLLLLSAVLHLGRGLLGLAPTSFPEIDLVARRWSAPLGLALVLYVPALAFAFMSMVMERAERELRQSAERMRESEARYRALVEASSAVFWRASPDGRVVVSDGWGQLDGLRPDAERGDGWLGLVHPDDRLGVVTRWREVRASGQASEHRYRVRTQTGEYRWMSARTVPLRGADGTIREWVGTLADIHNETVAREALARSEERYRLAAKATNDAIWDCDLVTGQIVWGEATQALFQYRADEIEPDSSWWRERVHLEDRRRAVDQVESAVASGASHWVQEYRFRRGDGTYAFVLDRGYVLRGRDGTPVRLIGAMQDLSGLKHAEAQILEKSAVLEATLENMDQGLIMVDDGGIVQVCNPRAIEILGLPGRYRNSRPKFSELIAYQASSGEFAGAVEGLTPWFKLKGDLLGAPPLYERTRPDGKVLEIRTVRLPGGGAVRTFTDITARRRLEAQLTQAQKMEAVGQLTGGIAHDFNNLLTIILGHADMLAADSALSVRARSQAQAIYDAGTRGSQLTRHLLAFGRRQSLKPEPLQLDAVIEGMRTILARAVGERIELRTGLAPSSLHALADRALFESALLNLVVNARDAMPDGGVVTIATGEASGSRGDGTLPSGQAALSVTVSDTGCGMSPAVAARAFEPFFTTKEVGKGSGLGLSMVYGFAQQSGGEVRIDSREGEGTAVTIWLPVAESQPAREEDGRTMRAAPGHAPAAQEPVRADVASRKRLLVVEDEPQVLKFVSAQLTGLGYDVTAVSNAPEALELLTLDDRFDLLFSDVVLPKGMSGVELAHRARELYPNLKVLLTSGYPEEVFQHHGRPEDGTALLRKPYRRKDLAEAIGNALAAESGIDA